MARMYTQQEVDDLLEAERQRTEKRMEERFNAERMFFIRILNMYKHKNSQCQEIIRKMSAEIMKKNNQIAQANREIVALRKVVGAPMSCGMQAMRLF
jgi:hypothetical protein